MIPCLFVSSFLIFRGKIVLSVCTVQTSLYSGCYYCFCFFYLHRISASRGFPTVAVFSRSLGVIRCIFIPMRLSNPSHPAPRSPSVPVWTSSSLYWFWQCIRNLLQLIASAHDVRPNRLKGTQSVVNVNLVLMLSVDEDIPIYVVEADEKTGWKWINKLSDHQNSRNYTLNLVWRGRYGSDARYNDAWRKAAKPWRPENAPCTRSNHCVEDNHNKK